MNKNHAVTALYDKKYLGLMPTAWTEKSGQPSTKYEHLVDYMEHPFVRLFIAYNENHHIYAGQYRDAPRSDDDPKAGCYYRAIRSDGRLHPQVNSVGQKGTRMTTRPNVQNQRFREREFIEAPPGRCLVASDKDALELRLAAVMAGVPELLDIIRTPGGDPHAFAAAFVYGNDFINGDDGKRKMLRDGTKTTVYAGLYGAGPHKIWQSIRRKKFLPPSLRARLTEQEVRKIIRTYFGRYPQIPAFHDRNYEHAAKFGYVETVPLGRRRWFPISPPPYTEIANWPIQTAGSDIVTMEMVQIQYELKRRFKDAFLILHGHDQAVAECYEKDAEAVKENFDDLFGKTYIEGPAGPCLLTAKAKIGKNLKEVK